MVTQSGINKENIQSIVNKNSLYIELMYKNLKNIESEFNELKLSYEDSHSKQLYEKFDSLSKNFEPAFNNLIRINNILNKVVISYQQTNTTITKSINSQVDYYKNIGE